jgi:asparagine synthase (glutamine-hydrolysing)
MEAYGVRVVLSGFGGDEFVTNQASNYFYDIFYEKDFAEFVRVCLKKGIPFMPAKMIFRDIWGRLGFNPFPRDMKQSATRYSLLLDKILDQRLEQTFPSSSTWSPPDRSHKKMIMNLISRPWLSYRLEAEAGFATGHGLINCYPLLDIRVLQYFLSLPARIIGEPGKTRTFFRQAMTGLIPDSVRLREDKSFPASPFSRLDVDERSVGYLTWLKEIEDLSQIGLVSKIDYAELLRRLDIGKKVNDAQGTMQQTVKFSTLSMIRFFHKTQNIIE